MPTRAPPAPHGAGLVERDAELAVLGALVERARTGEGIVAVVEAPAGIGKTSLLRAARVAARDRGLAVLGAGGSEMERDSPFGVVRQLFDPFVLGVAPSERDCLFEDAAGLARPVFGLPAASAGPADAEADPGHAVLHGLYWLLARLAARTPLLVAVDDIHWADGPSVRYLAFLIRRLEGLPVLLLLAGRPGHETAWAEALEEALGAAGAETVRPAALSATGVAAFIGDRLGEPPGAAFAAACVRVTRGNPFYLGGLLDEIAGAALRPLDEHAASVGRFAPGSVGRATLRATAGLRAGARNLVEALAILGDGADRELVRRLAGLPADVAADAVQALVRGRTLEPGDRLSFVHPIVRAAVYEEMAPADRAGRHAAAVTLMREEGADPDRLVAQLLLTAPSALPGTAAALEQAAEEALRRGAPETAARCLRRVLDEPLGHVERAAVRLRLGNAAAGAAMPEAEELLRAALALAETAGDRADAAVALARLLLLGGRTSAAVEVLAGLSDELEITDPAAAHRLDLELLAAADIDLSVRLGFANRLEQASRRVSMTGTADEPLVLSHGAIDVLRSGASAMVAADLAEAALAGRLGTAVVTRTLLRPLLIYVLVSAERYDAARKHCDALMATADAEGSAQLFVVGSASRSLISLRTGHLADSEALARQALDVATLNAWQPLQLLALIVLAETTLERSGPDAADLVLRRTALDLDAIESAQAAAGLLPRGRTRIAAGAVEAGCRDLLELGSRFTAWGMRNPAVSPWRSEAAIALAALGDHARASALAGEEVALARRWGTPRPLGVALRAQGLLDAGPAGRRRLVEAVDVLGRSSARLDRARALIDLGSALRRSGSRAASRDPLRRGVELAQACGAEPLAQRGRAELRVAGGRARSPLRTGVDALTPSEARIAAMAARGRSNPEIAQELFLTPKTIEMHLTGTYRKLGIASRRELPAALRDGADDALGAAERHAQVQGSPR